MIPAPLDDLIKTIARLPGLGRRSAQRAALHLLTHPDVMHTLQTRLRTVAEQIKTCHICNNLSLSDPCHICTDTKRAQSSGGCGGDRPGLGRARL